MKKSDPKIDAKINLLLDGLHLCPARIALLTRERTIRMRVITFLKKATDSLAKLALEPARFQSAIARDPVICAMDDDINSLKKLLAPQPVGKVSLKPPNYDLRLSGRRGFRGTSSFTLRDPNGAIHTGRNLNEFVRVNKRLFPTSSSAKTIITGLSKLRHGHLGSYLGWTVISEVAEGILNDREDLLGRKAAS